jgi:hypothetical protein
VVFRLLELGVLYASVGPRIEMPAVFAKPAPCPNLKCAAVADWMKMPLRINWNGVYSETIKSLETRSQKVKPPIKNPGGLAVMLFSTCGFET